MKRLCNILCLAALVGVSACASNSPQSSSKNPQLATEESSPNIGLVINLPIEDSPKRSYDTISMGRIAHGEVIEGEFTVHNNATQPLVIIDIITGCGCTTTQYDPKPIAPNQDRKIAYRFDSKTFIGQQFKSIEIITSDRSIATVYLSGQVYTP